MKRILLLFARSSVQAGRAYPEELAKALQATGREVAVTATLLDDLLFAINPDEVEILDTATKRALTEYDVVYFRHCGNANASALAVARFCSIKRIPFVDREMLHPGSLSKLTQYMNLHEAGVPFPKSIIARGALLEPEYAKRGFSFPLILKAAGGTRGQDNYLVQNAQQLHNILSSSPDTVYVLQQYMPNDGDYRVLVMGDEVKLVIQRKAAGTSHLNNTSQGGQASLVLPETLPQEVRTMAIRAAQFYAEDIAGVDIVCSQLDSRYYCLEVNRAPQIEHASFTKEKAAALVDYLVRIAR
jgi:glutathione synthase/RimK-type ligase-like ATP-grasp enzyme